MIRRIVCGLIVIVCLLLLTAIVSVIEIWGRWPGYFWFMNLVRAGWFSFVLVRIIVFFLVALAVRRLSRSSRAAGAAVAGLLILGVTIFSVMASYSPAGIYGVVDEIEGDGDHYYIFADGKVEDVYKDGRAQWGRYEKTADGWVLTLPDHRVFKLKSSWFGIWWTNVEAPDSTLCLGRRIIPFLRPDWMPNWLQ
jgi:ABC-type transport system involved in multi-copper enzyme maturation permease subunit